jgi:CDP-6-deoxy-D-xylo-4-hexulose-3-dehydrase
MAQNGFKINFVDVDKDTWNIDVNKIEAAITPNTCAIMPVNLLGNSCDYDRIIEICRKHNLMLIEDNCESMGAKYGDKYTGSIGLAGSFSFFFSHHIQTMEGGMVLTDSKDDADYMRSMRAHGWVRDLPDNSPLYQKTGDAFNDNFIFATPGYNIRPLEMSGAIGTEQLKKWDKIMDVRLKNKDHFLKLFADKPWVRVQKEIGTSSWFTFGMVLDGELKGRRQEVIDALSKAGIQNRPLASRNFLKQPVMRDLDYIDNKDYAAADDIHDNGFFVGNGSVLIDEPIDRLYEIISSFVK